MAENLVREEVTIEVPSEGSVMDAYSVRPSGDAACPYVVVAMELFGLNEHIRDVCDRLAMAGFAAIAPNFYHRTLPHAALPFGDEGRKEGFAHLGRLTRLQVLADLSAVLERIERQRPGAGVGILGFSVGGHIAYLAATQFPIAACACFYGGWITNSDIPISQPEPTLTLTPGTTRFDTKVVYFVGGKDHAISADQLKLLEEALSTAKVRHEIVVYPDAQHGFFCELRDTFDEAARDDSWRRVLALFNAELRGASRGTGAAAPPLMQGR